MTTLRIQDYLRSSSLPTGDPRILADLEVTYNVKARRHGRYPNLVLLKYGIDADFHSPMVRECRGIILDEADNWRVVCRTFDKFGNHGESYAATIDWSTAKVQTKEDGSLIQMFHYDGAWHVATSGSPDASGEVQRAGEHEAIRERSGKTFAEYFWETFRAEGGKTNYLSTEFCVAFELMGPLNRIVVVHERPTLRILGARHRDSGREFLPEDFDSALCLDGKAVRSFPLTTMAEIEASFATISPLSQEGYVVVDGAFNRVKIKHPGYVAIHHAKDGLGPRAFAEIARSGEVPEVVAAFPELAPLLEKARTDFARLVERTETYYQRIKHYESQKDFAASALTTPYSAALFKMRRGQTARDFYRQVPIDRLIEWMGSVSPTDEEKHAQAEAIRAKCDATLGPLKREHERVVAEARAILGTGGDQ